MKTVKQYFITFLGVIAVLAVVFGISEYYGEEMAVPVIYYSEEEFVLPEKYSPFAVDINTATAEELQTLDGVGKATAEKIIEYREKNGGFDNIEELCEVEGIGEAKFAAIKNMICASDYAVPALKEITAADDIDTEKAATEENIAVSASEKTTPVFPLDLNTASAEELTLIKGIGEVTAEKIITYAKEHGFSSVDELLEINGIGEKKLEAIRPYVTVKNPVKGTSAESSAENNIYPININTASEEELMKLNGVGSVIAGRIREYAENTGFKSVDDLINVKGIGEKKLEALRPYVTV